MTCFGKSLLRMDNSDNLHLKMFRVFCTSMLCLLVANAQPLSCKEDVHCSEGYFCETKANVCQECLRCLDLKREPPKPDTSNVCIKSIKTCGPCAEGFINIYRNGLKGKCVTPAFFEFASGSYYAYVWMTAVVIGLLVVVTFVYVIKHTDVFRVVAYYKPVMENPPATDTAMSTMPLSRHLLNYFLHYDKVIKFVAKSVSSKHPVDTLKPAVLRHDVLLRVAYFY